ncbi:hypothetical protein SAMN04488523_1394 [Sulfitobacter brevis]|uniref:Uncharacterized protein n=1 Tax=Sulfitobacter brevis TaxID=74348 RepID=A0A1I2H738_9RHOB|nr:hypothetical protein [Sulfitobacter brevis]SFF25183.1 hypothetical protein SAMN04488523_1394 [Sulfitobacter brevis]
MDHSRPQSRAYQSALTYIAITLLTILAVMPKVAIAHNFVVTLDATGAAHPVQLDSAVQGMRLAAGERDSHAAETSDGHLGGIDLFIRFRPANAGDGIEWLKGAPDKVATIIVDFSGSETAMSQVASGGAVVIGPGALPRDEIWSADTVDLPTGFAARYLANFGSMPDRRAAQGYNAALRIDQAVRSSGAVLDSDTLRQSLDLSAEGIDWP